MESLSVFPYAERNGGARDVNKLNFCIMIMKFPQLIPVEPGGDSPAKHFSYN